MPVTVRDSSMRRYRATRNILEQREKRHCSNIRLTFEITTARVHGFLVRVSCLSFEQHRAKVNEDVSFTLLWHLVTLSTFTISVIADHLSHHGHWYKSRKRGVAVVKSKSVRRNICLL